MILTPSSKTKIHDQLLSAMQKAEQRDNSTLFLRPENRTSLQIIVQVLDYTLDNSPSQQEADWRWRFITLHQFWISDCYWINVSSIRAAGIRTSLNASFIDYWNVILITKILFWSWGEAPQSVVFHSFFGRRMTQSKKYFHPQIPAKLQITYM